MNDVLASANAVSMSVPIVSNCFFISALKVSKRSLISAPMFSNVATTPLNSSVFFNLSRMPPSESNASNTSAKGFTNLSPNLDMANNTPEISYIDILGPRPPS